MVVGVIEWMNLGKMGVSPFQVNVPLPKSMLAGYGSLSHLVCELQTRDSYTNGWVPYWMTLGQLVGHGVFACQGAMGQKLKNQIWAPRFFVARAFSGLGVAKPHGDPRHVSTCRTRALAIPSIPCSRSVARRRGRFCPAEPHDLSSGESDAAVVNGRDQTFWAFIGVFQVELWSSS